MHIITDKGEENGYSIKLAFKTTNNEAANEALFFGMTIVKPLGGEEVEVGVDFQIMVSQVQGEFATKSEKFEKVLNIGVG